MSAAYTFQLTGGVRDPEQMRRAVERMQGDVRRGGGGGISVALGYDPRPCPCCGTTFEPDTTNQVDCAACVARIPYRIRRHGRGVMNWSATRSLSRTRGSR